MYEIVPATIEHVRSLAATMRAEDAAEVAAQGLTPFEAVRMSFMGSRDTMTWLCDGRVICMFGVGGASLSSEIVVPWLLTAQEMPKHWRPFLRESRRVAREMLARYGHLQNYVDSRYEAAVKWVKWLGFEVEPAVPFGPAGVPFHRITMKV